MGSPVPIHDPNDGRLRVAALASGSARSLLAILDKQRELESEGNADFEVVGLFMDSAEKARQLGPELSVPIFVNDIKDFYAQRGRPMKDLDLREEYDRETVRTLRTVRPHLVVFAGYVWITTAPLVSEFLCLNTHPADLSVRRNGRRAYAGADGVRDALLAGEKQLHSTVHVATEEVDSGPILMISEPVAVGADAGLDFEQRRRFYLKQLNEVTRALLVRVVQDLAAGAYSRDESGAVYYQGKPVPEGARA